MNFEQLDMCSLIPLTERISSNSLYLSGVLRLVDVDGGVVASPETRSCPFQICQADTWNVAFSPASGSFLFERIQFCLYTIIDEPRQLLIVAVRCLLQTATHL